MKLHMMIRNNDVTGDMPVKAFADEVIANMEAYNDYCDPWYTYVREVAVPYVGNRCYAVVDTTLADGCN